MKKLGLITLLAFATGGLLSGCLVSQKDPVTIARSTDNLRIYQPGDFILYDVLEARVTATDTQFTNGTLRIDWKSTQDLIDPNDKETLIPVLQEFTTLSFPNDDAEFGIGTVRYISQDDDINSPSYGSIRLHAIEAPGINKKYWLNSDGLTNGSPVAPFTVFPSPLAVTGPQTPVEFYVMDGCEINPETCTGQIGRFLTDTFDIVGDSTPRTTNLGTFTNPFEIKFSGNTQPLGGQNTLPVLFDIRGACGNNQPGVTSFTGTLFVLPEIGVVQMFVNCANSSNSSVSYTVTIDRTNISLP